MMFIQMYEEKFMRFPDGKCKAATFSYDDGVAADKKLLAIFKKYGIKGTFNLNSKTFDAQCWHGKLNEEDTYNLFSDCGQEIAMHGARHIYLDKVPMPEAVKELVDNRTYLEQKFNRIVRGYAYAYEYSERMRSTLECLGIAYARTTVPSYSFDIPKDWLKLQPTCHHSDARLQQLTSQFLSDKPLNEVKNRESLLLYVWGHSYEFDDNSNWEIIENLAKQLNGAKDEIWFATNIEIYGYIQAYNSLVYSIDGERVKNPSAIPVWVEVRGKTYKIEGGKEIRF